MKDRYETTTITIIIDRATLEKINKLRGYMMAPPSTSRWVKELVVDCIEQMHGAKIDKWRYDPAAAFAKATKKFETPKKGPKDVCKTEEPTEEITEERASSRVKKLAMSIRRNTIRG